MKRCCILLLSVVFAIGCSSTKQSGLPGEWEIIEFRLVGTGGDPVSDEKTLSDAGAVWEMQFDENGDFSQKFNMRDPDMKMEEESGTWFQKNDSLIIKLEIDTFTSTLPYLYEFKGDTLQLTLQNPHDNAKVITKFRKK